MMQEKFSTLAKHIDSQGLTVYAPAVRRFGENLRAIRQAQHVTQEELARRVGLKRQGPIAILETTDRLPLPATILKIAQALNRKPSEFLEEVETEYDRIRAGAYDTAAGRSRWLKALEELKEFDGPSPLRRRMVRVR